MFRFQKLQFFQKATNSQLENRAETKANRKLLLLAAASNFMRMAPRTMAVRAEAAPNMLKARVVWNSSVEVQIQGFFQRKYFRSEDKGAIREFCKNTDKARFVCSLPQKKLPKSFSSLGVAKSERKS